MNKLFISLAATTLAASVTAVGVASASTNDADTTFVPEDWYYTAMVTVSKDAPQTIGLDGVPAGDYVMSIQPNYTEYVEEAPTYWAQLDSAAKVELTDNIYMYDELTGDFKIAEGDTQFTISTTYEKAVEVYVMLYPVLEQNELPTTEEDATEFTLWENYEFQYTHEGATGFYTMTPSVTGAEFGIILKTNPVYYTGESVEDAEYPVYLEKGTTYYFSIALVGLPEGTSEDVNSVNAYFTFTSWTPKAIAYNTSVFVPVTYAEAATHTTVKINPAGLVPNTKYALNLIITRRATLTAHFVKADDSEALEPITSASGAFEFVYNADIDSVYFTSDNAETFAARAYLGYAAAESQNIALGEQVRITIRPNETIPASITGITATAANYNITINNNNVTVSGSTGDIIPQGETAATYPIYKDYYADTYVGASLYFTNNGTESVTVDVIVEMVEGDYDLKVGTANSITLAPQTKVSYFIPEFEAGTYRVTLTNGEGIAVYAYIDLYTPIVSGETGVGEYTLILNEGTLNVTAVFTFENTGSSATTFTFLIEKI